MPRGPQHTPIEERLRKNLRLNPETGCHEWIAGVVSNGYARIALGGRGSLKAPAHRIAYELAKGAIPLGLQLDHLCRNRRCCNPDHLEPVTPRENQLRGYGVTGIHARKTHCKRGHEFTPENTYSDAPNRRHCRACRQWTAQQRKGKS